MTQEKTNREVFSEVIGQFVPDKNTASGMETFLMLMMLM